MIIFLYNANLFRVSSIFVMKMIYSKFDEPIFTLKKFILVIMLESLDNYLIIFSNSEKHFPFYVIMP